MMWRFQTSSERIPKRAAAMAKAFDHFPKRREDFTEQFKEVPKQYGNIQKGYADMTMHLISIPCGMF